MWLAGKYFPHHLPQDVQRQHVLLGKAEEVWPHADDCVASSHLAGVGIAAGVEHGQKVLEQQKV